MDTIIIVWRYLYKNLKIFVVPALVVLLTIYLLKTFK